MKNNDSIWLKKDQRKREYRTLEKNLKTDVCVIGGGITGISTAYYLSKKGLQVAILEKDKIGSKTTGKTTGKITSQHHLFYRYLLDSQGKEFAKKYWKVNEEAIQNIETIIKTEKIDCHFEKKSAFVFTKELGKLQGIQDEIDATKVLGIESKFTNEIEVLGKIEGAIEFPNQAQFNPIEYVYSLANCVLQNSGKIYENSKVVEYTKEDDGFVITVEAEGIYRKIFAKQVVVATRYPIFNVPGFHFIKMYQELEYALAIKTNQKLKGMYVSSEVPTISFRDYEENGENYILLVGSGCKTGEITDNNGFDILETFARKYFPKGEIMYRWHAEDAIGLDKIPYIGEYSEVRENMYVATGFKKWGMTTSNIAARMITDLILKGESKYEEIFKSTRVEPVKNREEMKNMLKEVGESIIKPRLKNEKKKKYCAHLGCELSWNEVTETWDCPCHGSRYEKDGSVIEGPAVHNLEE